MLQADRWCALRTSTVSCSRLLSAPRTRQSHDTSLLCVTRFCWAQAKLVLCGHGDQCPLYECPLAHTPDELADNVNKHRCFRADVETAGPSVYAAVGLCVLQLHSALTLSYTPLESLCTPLQHHA